MLPRRDVVVKRHRGAVVGLPPVVIEQHVARLLDGPEDVVVVAASGLAGRPPEELVRDLDALPLPDYGGFFQEYAACDATGGFSGGVHTRDLRAELLRMQRLVEDLRLLSLAEAGQLVVLTTHDLTLAAQADQLTLLGPQGFVAHGPPTQILHDDTAWARLGLSVPDWARPPAAEPVPSDTPGGRP